MYAAASLLAVIAVLSGSATYAHGDENPEVKTSEVLNVLVEPLKGFSGYYISVDDGALGMRGVAKDPAAYLRAVQSVPMFSGARLSGPEVATGAANEERMFALTARFNGNRATAGADTAHPGAASAAEISAATDGIFKSARCVHVSELAAPPGRIMFRCGRGSSACTDFRLCRSLWSPSVGYSDRDVRPPHSFSRSFIPQLSRRLSCRHCLEGRCSSRRS